MNTHTTAANQEMHMQQKLYSQADLNKVLTWVDHKIMADFLHQHGISPVQVMRTPQRVYRVFDESGMSKAKQLAKERKLAKHAELAQAALPALAAAPVQISAHEKFDALMAKLDTILAKVERVCEAWDVK